MRCVVRNDEGEFLRATCNITNGRRQSRKVEALSLKEALSWMKGSRNSKCIFESDAKLLIDALNGSGGSSFFDTTDSDCVKLL